MRQLDYIDNSSLVWYAGYGSNLSEERFIRYIKGGTPQFGIKKHVGCRDKSIYLNKKGIEIPFELYFAKQSSSWQNAGVAFINSDKADSSDTFCSCYLIRIQQLIDIFLQENDAALSDIDEKLFSEMLIQRQGDFVPAPALTWYGRIILLQDLEGIPVYTFTASWQFSEVKLQAPGVRYLKTILQGLQKSHGLSIEDSIRYLMNKKGIADFWESKQLFETIQNS